MSGFSIPVKEIIVNDDAQVRLLEDDGTVYAAADCTPSAGGFVLEGFLSMILGSKLVLLAAATRIRKEVPVAAVTELKSYVLTDVAGSADSVFRIVYEDLNFQSEYQNQPLEKRYQISSDWAAVDTLGAAIAAAINADKYAPVTAAYTAATDTLLVTAKRAGVKFSIYSSDITLPAATGETKAALGINIYDSVKNANWARNVEIDRTLNYVPLPGVTYNLYYFEFDSDSVASLGGLQVPSVIPGSSRNAVKLWVKDGLTLEAKLDLLVTDVNV